MILPCNVLQGPQPWTTEYEGPQAVYLLDLALFAFRAFKGSIELIFAGNAQGWRRVCFFVRIHFAGSERVSRQLLVKGR